MTLGTNPLSRRDNIVIQELRGEVLIYDLIKNKALCLNQTSALIWQECDGTKSVSDISRDLTEKLKSNISEDLVWLALNQFKQDNLLAQSSEFVNPFENLSRREIVKRIGFASIVALPIISSVIAPTAVNAQSGGNCAPIGNCTGGTAGICICTPPVQPGGNNNPAGCGCLTNGDCQGDCRCGNPCTGGSCPTGETCQSGQCRDNLGGGSLTLCNGTCPQGTTCITDSSQSNFGSCSGVCPPSPGNVCVGGNSNPICISGDTSNLNPDCCPCANVEGCQNCCNDGICGPCIG